MKLTKMLVLTLGSVVFACGGDEIVDSKPIVATVVAFAGGKTVECTCNGTNCELTAGFSVKRNSIIGTYGDDIIDCSSSTRNLYIVGNGGSDIITGGLGHDDIYDGDVQEKQPKEKGQKGPPTLVPFPADDHDILDGGPGGKDWIMGGLGIDMLIGRSDNDYLVAGDGNDMLCGGTATTDAIADFLNGEFPSSGGTDPSCGSDPNPGFDDLAGGDGNDFCDFGGGSEKFETGCEPSPECSDGLDNDGDGLTDFSGGDPNCLNALDNTEEFTLTVSSLSPSSGSTAGGTTVTIAGTDLIGATAVTFGGVAATNVTFVSYFEITAVSPLHAAGTVDVVVTTLGGTSAAVVYEYKN